MQLFGLVASVLCLPCIPVTMMIAVAVSAYLFASRPGTSLASADKDSILKQQAERERRNVDPT